MMSGCHSSFAVGPLFDSFSSKVNQAFNCYPNVSLLFLAGMKISLSFWWLVALLPIESFNLLRLRNARCSCLSVWPLQTSIASLHKNWIHVEKRVWRRTRMCTKMAHHLWQLLVHKIQHVFFWKVFQTGFLGINNIFHVTWAMVTVFVQMPPPPFWMLHFQKCHAFEYNAVLMS